MRVASRIESRSWDRYLMLYAGNVRGAAQADSATRRLTKGQGAQVVFELTRRSPADVISSCLPRCARHLNAGSKSGPPTASDIGTFSDLQNAVGGTKDAIRSITEKR